MGYADQMNLYGYCANDPVNATDPSGMVEEITNGNGNSVWVDGDGDGDVMDNDLTDEQTAALGREFSDFIDQNQDLDLSAAGLDVTDKNGNTLITNSANMLRTVSQFVGTHALRGGKLKKTFERLDAIVITADGKAPKFDWGNIKNGNDRILWPSTFGPDDSLINVNSPSNIARVMLHELGHSSRLNGPSTSNARHQENDRWARRQLNRAGLYGGGCVAKNGFPKC